MNSLIILLVYVIMAAVCWFFLKSILKSFGANVEGFGLGSFRLKRGMRGFDFKNHPIKSAGKLFLAVMLFMFYWSGMGTGALLGNEAAVVSGIAAIFFACALTDIFIYGSKLFSIVAFLGIYLGFYYLENGMTENLTKTIAVLLFAAVCCLIMFGRKK